MANERKRGLNQGPSRRFNWQEQGESTRRGSGFDQTIQPSAQHKVMVDRPMYDHADSLIFRPLPALEDEDRPATSKMLPYRFAIDPRAWSDFWVRYPAAAGVGTGDRRTTFLLCESGEDIRETPYSVLFEAVRKEVSPPGGRQSRAPRQWDQLWSKGGRDLILGKAGGPTSFGFFRGLTYIRGATVYIKDGLPRGLADDDPLMVQRVSDQVCDKLVDLFNELAEEFNTNTPIHEAMAYGDPVHPLRGRFIRVISLSPKSGREDDTEDLQRWDLKGGRKRKKKDAEGGGATGGYDVAIDEVLRRNGKPIRVDGKPLPATLTKEEWKLAKRKFLPWSRILSIPGPEEQALIIAKAMPDCRLILEWAWRGTPFLTKEVKQVLDAFQGPQLITKGIADAADTEFDEGFSSKHGRKRVSRGVPRDVYDEEAEELPAEDELDEEVGDEFDEEFADEEFADEEFEGEEEAGEADEELAEEDYDEEFEDEGDDEEAADEDFEDEEAADEDFEDEEGYDEDFEDEEAAEEEADEVADEGYDEEFEDEEAEEAGDEAEDDFEDEEVGEEEENFDDIGYDEDDLEEYEPPAKPATKKPAKKAASPKAAAAKAAAAKQAAAKKSAKPAKKAKSAKSAKKAAQPADRRVPPAGDVKRPEPAKKSAKKAAKPAAKPAAQPKKTAKSAKAAPPAQGTKKSAKGAPKKGGKKRG